MCGFLPCLCSSVCYVLSLQAAQLESWSVSCFEGRGEQSPLEIGSNYYYFGNLNDPNQSPKHRTQAQKRCTADQLAQRSFKNGLLGGEGEEASELENID